MLSEEEISVAVICVREYLRLTHRDRLRQDAGGMEKHEYKDHCRHDRAFSHPLPLLVLDHF
ncbi:MAG: hypothetical protein ACREKS_20080 [Candidatus Rokuibacteriota bacterium]